MIDEGIDQVEIILPHPCGDAGLETQPLVMGGGEIADPEAGRGLDLAVRFRLSS
jgi:hypothetical protein